MNFFDKNSMGKGEGKDKVKTKENQKLKSHPYCRNMFSCLPNTNKRKSFYLTMVQPSEPTRTALER